MTQDYYLGRKIASEDAARALEIIGRPDAAALIASETTSRETALAKPAVGLRDQR